MYLANLEMKNRNIWYFDWKNMGIIFLKVFEKNKLSVYISNRKFILKNTNNKANYAIAMRT